MIIHNLNQLVSIEVKPVRECKDYKYVPAKKTFWGRREECFIDLFDKRYSAENLVEEGFVVTHGMVFRRASVELQFSNGKMVYREFEKPMDAIEWARKIKSTYPLRWLEV